MLICTYIDLVSLARANVQVKSASTSAWATGNDASAAPSLVLAAQESGTSTALRGAAEGMIFSSVSVPQARIVTTTMESAAARNTK